MKNRKNKETDRQPPIKIPLTFNKAIEGLLAVKPKSKEVKSPKK